jgi:hypothetical protein
MYLTLIYRGIGQMVIIKLSLSLRHIYDIILYSDSAFSVI